MRHLFRLTLAAALLFMVGVTPSAADTITYDRSATSRCVDIAAGSVMGPAELNHMILEFGLCPTNPLQDTDSVAGTLGPGALDATLPAALTVTGPTLGGDDKMPFLPLEGVSLPPSSIPSDATTANATPLQVVTPAGDITAVPEPGSLLLLGSSLLLFARMVRSRVK